MDNNALAKISEEYRVDIERIYPYPIAAVWKAITTAEDISAWMNYPAKLDRHLGGRIYVDFNSEGSLEGMVCEWVPERVFAYTWGLSVVRWTLESREGGTHLHFTNSSVTPDIIMGFASGWHAFIDHLGPHLAGETFDDRYDAPQTMYADHHKDIHERHAEVESSDKK